MGSMKPTDVLKQEHRVIEQVLDCLEQMTTRIRVGEDFDRADGTAALEFVRGFADSGHHGKEENCLFPAMVDKGVPGDVGPVGVMLAEHDVGRAAVGEMATALEAEDDEAFGAAASGYVELMREHILKEDNILFPMADSLLGDRQDELARAFARVDADDIGADRHEELVAIADRLATRYEVAPATERTQRPFHGCVHQEDAVKRG